MAIHRGSRYQSVLVERYFDQSKNQLIPMLTRRIPPQSLSNVQMSRAKTRIWTIDDRIDNVAYEEYQNNSFWWAIMDANPKYMSPYDIQVGDVIIIPPYEAIREALGNG
jgi:hypothetical protein